MKLAMVSGAYPPLQCGEASNTYYLSQYLADAGLEIELVTTRREGMPCPPGVTIHGIMNRWSWGEVPRLIRCLVDIGPDAILLIYLGGIYRYHPMVTFLPTFVRWRLPRTRFVTRFENIMGGWTAQEAGVPARMIRKLLETLLGKHTVSYMTGTLTSHSSAIIVLCDYHRMLLMKSGRNAAGKILVIPPATNVRTVPDPEGTLRATGRQLLGIEVSHTVLGYLGYIYPNKGVDTLLKAFALVAKDNQGARLMIIGGPPDIGHLGVESYSEQIAALINQLEISDRVIWVGSVAPHDERFPSLIHAADLWALPFDRGLHLNNSSFSALAAYGQPVIGTQGSFAESQLRHGDNVYFCRPQDPGDLARAITRLLSEPELRRQLIAGVSKLSTDWLAWSRVIERTVGAIEAPAPVAASS